MTDRPVLALLTDFGTRDHYAGVLKGVIAGICPDATVIDITHEIAPQDVRAAAFTLAAAWRYFPDRTVFVVVVDPGVGTDRPAVAVRLGSVVFVGPDNGVFDLVVAEGRPLEARALTARHLMRPTVSATFEGRARFAPVAARLASGTPFEDVGPLVAMATRLAWPEPREEGRSVVGRVLAVDRFGNLITSFTRARWEPVVVGAAIRVGDAGPIPLVRTYGEAAPGALVALFGSTDYLELAVVGGSAAETLGAGVGTDVHVVRGA